LTPPIEPSGIGADDRALAPTTPGGFESAGGGFTAGAPNAGGPAATQSSEQLQSLEQQLVQLLEQVRSLQAAQNGSTMSPGGGPAMAGSMMMGTMPGMPGMMSGAAGSGMMGMGSGSVSGFGGMGMGMGAAGMASPGIEVVESVEVRVYRTTYRLPEDKAQAVQQFVKQNFVSEVETRVDGNTLVVLTHSADDEETMRRFIYLMVGAPLPQTGGAPALPPSVDTPTLNESLPSGPILSN